MLEAKSHRFAFRILGVHYDNGSEFFNHQVVSLLNKLLVGFAKSRAYCATDHALGASKNGAVLRKHIGHGPTGAQPAEAFHKFDTAPLNSYPYYHRPCGFAVLWNVPHPDGGLVLASRIPQPPPFAWYPIPLAPVSVTSGGQPAKVVAATAQPLRVSGMLPVTAEIPASIGLGEQPIVLTFGNNSNSQQWVTAAA